MWRYYGQVSLLSPAFMAADVEKRRDRTATLEQVEETFRVEVAFRTRRVLMSTIQIKAEIFLRQN